MPPIRLERADDAPSPLKPGDVLMVHRTLRNKETGKPFTWKWLGVIERMAIKYHVRVIRLGADEDKDRVMLRFGDERNKIWLLPEEEWPDGVWAFRTKLILEGRLDDAVLG